MVIPPVNPAAVAKVIGPVVLNEAKKRFKKYLSKNRGSKVKMGEFAGASVSMFGDKACIKLDKAGSQVLLLTSESIQSYRYVREKYRKSRRKMYYYYDIVFKDGTESYVRMSKKCRDAMISYM